MNMNTNKFFAALLVVASGLISCNKDVTFPNFEYQTVYFASQFPVRTVVLGEDLIVDNSLDKERKISIKATMGGAYENIRDITIGYEVDESLCDNLYFSATGDKVLPMPASYYTLASDKITIPRGSILGGVEVQLTDAFFADTLSLVNTYVIPLLIKDVQGLDSILRGVPAVSNPNRAVSLHWSVAPRDYVLYAVKYINPWHGTYLRRGKDVITGTAGNDELDSTVVRRKEYVEEDEIKSLSTKSMSRVEIPLSFPDASGTNISMNLQLTFDGKGDCSVEAAGTDYTATGTGKFVAKGEQNSWGGVDRDALYLSYTIDHPLMQIVSSDTLVMRNRGVAPEYYSPVVRE